MEQFPDSFTPAYKGEFTNLYYNIVMEILRKEIYSHVISNDENSYFPLDNFFKKYNITDDISDMTSHIVQEITNMGWKCKTSFGGTGLFVYSTENPPPSCYDDTFN